MNTTARGDRFRDQVADLLRAAGYVATAEILQDHKRIDVLFEQTTFGKHRRYALEAKNWAKPLNHSELERIYAGYASFVSTRKIDELLIVSPHELKSPAAKAYVRDTPGVSHLSFNEFQESLLGFHEYLSNLVHNHERDGLEKYFIQPIMENDGLLHEYIEDWVEKDGCDPLAIIASYGMGKTSFARHLCYVFGKAYLSGRACRVPVLVSLGLISREQSIPEILTSGSVAIIYGTFLVVLRRLEMLR